MEVTRNGTMLDRDRGTVPVLDSITMELVMFSGTMGTATPIRKIEVMAP
jgi:hypothetical protein